MEQVSTPLIPPLLGVCRGAETSPLESYGAGVYPSHSALTRHVWWHGDVPGPPSLLVLPSPSVPKKSAPWSGRRRRRRPRGRTGDLVFGTQVRSLDNQVFGGPLSLRTSSDPWRLRLPPGPGGSPFPEVDPSPSRPSPFPVNALTRDLRLRSSASSTVRSYS